MKYYFFILIVIGCVKSGLGHDFKSKKIFQNNRLIGIEKYNQHGQLIFEKGVTELINDTVRQSKEHTQYFYDDSGRLEIEIIGSNIYNASIKSYEYGPLGLSAINKYLNSYPNFPILQLYGLFQPVDTEQFSNLYLEITDTLWLTKAQVQNEMKRRRPTEILEVYYHKGQSIEHTYSYSLHEEIKHSSYEYTEYDFESGEHQTIHVSDCAGYPTGAYYPVKEPTGYFKYDTLGRLIEMHEYGDGRNIVYDSQTNYTYSSTSQLVESNRWVRQFKTEDDYRPYEFKDYERRRIYIYDPKGRLISETSTNSKGKMIASYTKSFNAQGDLISYQNSKKESIVYTVKYNRKHQKVMVKSEKKLKDLDGFFDKKTWIHTYKYSKSGELIEVEEKVFGW